MRKGNCCFLPPASLLLLLRWKLEAASTEKRPNFFSWRDDRWRTVGGGGKEEEWGEISVAEGVTYFSVICLSVFLRCWEVYFSIFQANNYTLPRGGGMGFFFRS